MLRRKPKTQHLPGLLHVNGHDIDVFLHIERRRGGRVSIGKKGVHLRLPTGLTNSQQKDMADKLLKWAKSKMLEKDIQPGKAEHRIWKDGDQLALTPKTYHIRVEPSSAHRGSIRLKRDEISIFIPTDKKDFDHEAVSKAIRKLIAKDNLDWISSKIDHLNDLYFQKEISNIRLKYNSSNWGSCSSKKNINISTRLLFAPEPVIDYVCIHELAHLIEGNHSNRFWKLVEDVMPGYKQHVKYLKAHGGGYYI